VLHAALQFVKSRYLEREGQLQYRDLIFQVDQQVGGFQAGHVTMNMSTFVTPDVDIPLMRIVS
jgi:hypothetical protein